MFDLNLYLSALGLMLVLAITGWIVSVIKRNVTLVDSLWSLFILLAGSVYIFHENTLTSRDFLLISLILIWSIRLSLYLTWRNRGGHEDHRYQTIRRNNNPHFWLKSLYIIFGLQVILAWIVSLPLLGAANSTNDLNWRRYWFCPIPAWLRLAVYRRLATEQIQGESRESSQSTG